MNVIKTEQAAGPAAQPTRTAASVAAPRTSFARVLAKSSAVTATKAPDTSKTAGAETTQGSAKAETTRKVAGHDYVEVMSGPRNGMFINTSHNENHGKAFVLVHKRDHDLHIYGSGQDRRVIIDYNRTSDDAARKKTEAARTTGGVSAPSA
jgi:hypothetical protein